MKQELQDKLFEKYPLIFQDKDKPVTETCMFWGIETGDGWYDLIDKLCSFLQWHTDKNKYPQVIAEQVKEKFGGLCFYYRSVPDHTLYFEGAIDFAESVSHRICEDCGMPGTTGGRGWVRTLCPKCRGEI